MPERDSSSAGVMRGGLAVAGWPEQGHPIAPLARPLARARAHGIGIESAEMPLIGTALGEAFDDAFVLAPGMVIVLEPVVWVDGVGGYRAEEVVAVTDDGWQALGGEHPYDPFVVR